MSRVNVLQRLRCFFHMVPVALIVGAGLNYGIYRDIVLSSAMVFVSVFISALPIPAPSSSGKPGAFIAQSISLLVLLLMGVMAFNYILNPLGIYPTSYFEPLVLNHDTTYRYKTNLYDNMSFPPEVVILGSSRSFTMPPAYITEVTGLLAFNASVHGGTLNDIIQFTRHMVDEGHPPRVIIVGLPTELMVHKHKENKQATTSATSKKSKPSPSLTERLLGADAYRSLNDFRADLSYNIDLARQLVSWYQTKESIRQLEMEFEGRPGAFYRIDQDGLVHFDAKVSLKQAVQGNIAEPMWGELFSRADEFNQGGVAAVKRLLNLCRKNHITVIFYLPPYQPQMLAVYEQQNLPRLKAEQLELFAALQDEYDFTVYDMTTVESFGGDETMFIDGVHPTEDAARLILDILLKDVPQE